VAAVMLLISASAVLAQDPKGWKTELDPYTWLAGMEGDATVDGQKAEFDKSFSDLVELVEFGAGLLGTVRHGRYVTFAQLDFMDLSTDALDVQDRPEGGKLDTSMFIHEVGGGYRINGWKEGQTIDVMIGLRGMHLESDLEVYGQGKHSSEADIVDPMIVVRPSVPIFPSRIDGLRFTGTLAIGGGGDSDLIYELQPQLRYQFHEHVSARLGYRRIGWKFEADGNDDELNMSLNGLVLGFGVTF